MNQPQGYMDPHGPPSGPAPGYSYGGPQPLQPAAPQYHPGNYAQPMNPYTMAPMSQGYAVPAPVSHSQALHAQPVPMASMPPSHQAAAAQNFQPRDTPFDQTGQVAPPGIKPRVTATLWEDEGSLCFQVEARGVCVARREDNHMINGTKLLNVAGMTRGRRDGILKSEKTRHVVKIGPMHLKGVWIPFDRALDFANKEKITEALYPLFVHNIGALLYHPQNQQRGNSISGPSMGPRRSDSQSGTSNAQQQEYMRTPTGTQPPAMPHHHSMSGSGNMAQPPHGMAPHGPGRPGIDRAHTFPTPPTSASSLLNMGGAPGAYDYSAQNSSLNAAATPPQSATQGMSYANAQPYDQSRGVYQTPSSYQQYGNSQYGPGPSVKTEMAQARAGAENDNTDGKAHNGYSSYVEADGEYTHRPVHNDPTHISPEMANSPQQNGSGRATPRTTNTTSYMGYSTPQRGVQMPSSNLYNVMSNESRPQSGAEGYPSQNYQAPAAHYPTVNGVSSGKRSRDDDDDYGRSTNSPGGPMKRQRTEPSNIASRPISQPQSVKPVR